MSTPKRKPNNAGKVMVMAKKCFDIELTPAEAQKIVNLWVEQGIEITLELAKKPPRNLIAFTNWIFPRIGWGLNRLNWSDTQYDDYKRQELGRPTPRSRDELLQYRDERGIVQEDKLIPKENMLGEILKKVKPCKGK